MRQQEIVEVVQEARRRGDVRARPWRLGQVEQLTPGFVTEGAQAWASMMLAGPKAAR